MSLFSAALLALAIVLLLFGIAAFVERRGGLAFGRHDVRHAAYALALGVYCSSWTFYGAVGSAVRDGWHYLPIYLAPICLLIVAPRFLRRLAEAVAEERATTVSDFIAARFGHDVVVARLVTIIALLGTVPYVALQFRSIGGAISIVTGRPVATMAMLTAAWLLSLFAMLFGARRFELAGRSEGLVYAIGLESLLKIVALTTVAVLAIVLLGQADAAGLSRGTAILAANFRPERLSMEVGVIFLISVMAIIVLPRQFYMGLVEAREPGDLEGARWGLAAYLAAMALMVLPVALAGASLLHGAQPDLYMLQLPEMNGQGIVLALALLGGIAAAASMVVVDSTALATMVSNDLLFPTLLARESGAEAGAGTLGRRMLLVRRFSIVAIMAAALAWALLVSAEQSLASIGLVAFAAMAQFTPHLILATYAPGRDALAARASLAVGLVIWFYTLALPPILPPAWLAALAGSAFDPLRLFGIGAAAPLVHGVAWSLGANLLVFGLVAARKVKAPALPSPGGRPITDLAELAQLTASFVGEEEAAREFPAARRGAAIDRRSAQRARELIARVVGASSARALVASALAGGQMSLSDVTRLLGERGQSLRFSRELLAATFEHIDAGISVVDADMNLVAWNSQYLDMFDFPPDFLRVGTPIADLIRHNGRLGDFGGEDIEFHVKKRLRHMRRGLPHSFERRRRDGRVIKTIGGPMPGGGYVTSFIDITEDARIRDELSRTLAELENRVADRTRELSDANLRLAEATKDKTRFLAAASHDLLQPLHAARLFTAALQREVEGMPHILAQRVDSAIVAAEGLLRALLDISKLDAGGVQPSPEPIDLAPFLANLADGFAPMAKEKGLRLLTGPLAGHVETDPGLLRSVLQNFVSNALRYTRQGGILLGVRRRGGMIRIDIVDTGVGIAADQIETIFGEFTRLGALDVEGFGLGLALARRIVRLLGGSIEVRSVPGKGSRFSLLMPEGAGRAAPRPAPEIEASMPRARNMAVLVVDDDPMIVAATGALLASLGHRALTAGDGETARNLAAEADAALVDFQLGGEEDGLSLIATLRREHPGLPAALVTAEDAGNLAARAAVLDIAFIAKPAAPEVIAAFLDKFGNVG
ncbi:multi-sensor hybrid histidine kinase [Sphingobium chlorophenolicum L-1]|uniref:histidine kinase n=1 Tax=Sphingobium chlorophenolicum L-1 TaxID=690566 RepID=F6F196_SPHCR|nr:PAS-domain containing protein [Sphingobium chlorophenolicum]AEG51312.1 multi-sensor hybrid histidine kinase [Sphingobium chlorophenolicum L-1]